VDVVSALTSVLMRMGQAFAEHGGRTGPGVDLLHPAALFRMGRGYLRSRLQGRPLLPKDLWPARAILGWGEDTSFYKPRIAYYWGQEPYEFFGTTESGVIALESWARQGLVFTPFLAFLEFLPDVERGAIGSDKNGGEPPPTVSLDQVRAGETYELLFTSFYGMPFMRYRSGYLLKVMATEDRKSGVRLPHFAVAGRADSIIDLGGFTRLDEGLLTQAVHRAGLQCEGWVARKEYSQDGPQIHMYLGLARPLPEGEVLEALHQALMALDNPYRSLVELLGARPLAVTLLAPEGFKRYARGGGPGETGKACAWVNPPEAVVEGLLSRG
jgi:hypothetical protein